MKEFIQKRENINKIEFWAATTLFVFLVFFHITDTLDRSGPFRSNAVQDASQPFNFRFVSGLIRYALLYTSFLFLNFVVVPGFLRKQRILLYVLMVLVTFLFVGVGFGVTNTHLKSLFDAYGSRPDDAIIFQRSFLIAAWLLLLFAFYTVIKYVGLHLLSRADSIQARYKVITPGGLVVFVLWMIVLFFLLVASAPREIIAVWTIMVPCSILLHGYAFHYLIPQSLNKKKPIRAYALRIVLVLALSILPVWLLGVLLTSHEDISASITSFNAAFQLLLIAPLSWILFKRQQRGNAELYALRTELGRSNANFDFLRSQINPHFLFNALNTIYGTAIQEKAERTSEGIERLGDMMRFMLQENMQEKIALTREIDYLNNYISLQKLRTDPNPNIRIETGIENPVRAVQIAPMLLIPFVENAFKHGISFREPSYIKVTLEMRDTKLYFDVHNSKHVKLENDPEKDKSGIGLNNVKQRLQLLYPSKHELIIRETGKDFFIHLTIQLS